MSARRNVPASNPPASGSHTAQLQAEAAVDQAVAATEEAMRAALGSTAGAVEAGRAPFDAVAQAEQALAAAVAGTSESGRE